MLKSEDRQEKVVDGSTGFGSHLDQVRMCIDGSKVYWVEASVYGF